MFTKVRGWVDAHHNWTLVVITVMVLCPFITKPFNIDDPLFIWTAQQIQTHPGDPYGFEVNWYGTRQPMWLITQNPPGAGYFLALAAAIFGWSETGLHFALMLPAIVVILGTWRLAKLFCRRPLFAAMASLLSPVFLISANTAMCDVLMLAFWVWAVVFWVEGLPASFWKLAAAGLLIALAEMTKYYGVCLMPLLAAHAAIKRTPAGSWLPFLLIPLAALCAYEYATATAYGRGLLSGAMNYPVFYSTLHHPSKIQGAICGLAFTGGGLAAVFFAPQLWRKRGLLVFAAMMAVVLLFLWHDLAFWQRYPALEVPVLAWTRIQMAFWMTAGFGILTLAVADTWRRPDASSILLLLWVGGTFCFASFCNWTVNGRSILPMTPAVAILIVRRLETKTGIAVNGLWLSTAMCLVFAFLLECADFSEAVAVRRSTEVVQEKYAQSPGAMWFQGHWGFQYYMSEAGATPVDFSAAEASPGDKIVLPASNTNIRSLNPQNTVPLDVFMVPIPASLAVWDAALGAGFYDAARGPLPFAFGRVPAEKVFVYQLKSPATTR